MSRNDGVARHDRRPEVPDRSAGSRRVAEEPGDQPQQTALVRNMLDGNAEGVSTIPAGQHGASVAAAGALLHLQRAAGNHAVGVLVPMNRVVAAGRRPSDKSDPGRLVVQRQPDPAGKPLQITIKIASSQTVVENANLSGPKKDLVNEISKDLQKQFVAHLKKRLAFLESKKILLSISFGEFAAADLTVPGNIQVWLVPELDEKFAPGTIMKRRYKYTDKAARDANDEFTDDPTGGPGRDPRNTAGLTVGSTSDPKHPKTARPIFVKLRESFVARGGLSTDISEYKRGRKAAAQARIGELATTTLHELGHLFGTQHTEGNLVPVSGSDVSQKLKFKQSFPPRLMDTERGTGQGGYQVISNADIEKLGGWAKFVKLLEHPSIKKAEYKGDGMHVWVDYTQLDFDKTQQETTRSFAETLRAAKNVPAK